MGLDIHLKKDGDIDSNEIEGGILAPYNLSSLEFTDRTLRNLVQLDIARFRRTVTV